MRATPDAIKTHLSTKFVFKINQFCKPPAKDTMPAEAVNTIQPMSFQLAVAKFFILPFKSSATPAGSRTKINGTKIAGATYFQLWKVVLYGNDAIGVLTGLWIRGFYLYFVLNRRNRSSSKIRITNLTLYDTIKT